MGGVLQGALETAHQGAWQDSGRGTRLGVRWVALFSFVSSPHCSGGCRQAAAVTTTATAAATSATGSKAKIALAEVVLLWRAAAMSEKASTTVVRAGRLRVSLIADKRDSFRPGHVTARRGTGSKPPCPSYHHTPASMLVLPDLRQRHVSTVILALLAATEYLASTMYPLSLSLSLCKASTCLTFHILRRA